MKNDKSGFTLVELIAVLLVIGLISLIIIPIVVDVINESSEEAYKVQIKNILNSAERWSLEKLDPDVTVGADISLSKLIKDGYLENKDYIDPRTDKKMDGCVTARYDKNQYKLGYEERAC